MFPEIREALREFRKGFGSELVELGINSPARENIGFDARLTPEQAKFLRLHGLFDGPAWSGEAVSERTARNLSTFWSCERLISEAVSFLPLQLMQEKAGSKRPAKSHPLYRALHDMPNPEMTSMSFRESRTSHVLVGGNGFAQVVRRSGTGTALELWPLMPNQVRPDREKAGQRRLVLLVKDGNAAEKTFTVTADKPQDILHIPGLSPDGIWGYSILSVARQSLGTALAQERYVGSFFAGGGRVPYLLKTDGKFKTDQEFEAFRAKWTKLYSDPNSVPMLEGGLEYEQIGAKPGEFQLLESRLATPAEICRWFLLSPDMVGDLSRATHSNVEELSLRFYKMTLSAWLSRWEQNLFRCVLTPEEQAGGYFFKHNIDGLLRGDFLTRMQGHAIALQNAIRNPNEVRNLEDLDPFEGGDDYHIQLNQQTLGAGTPTASQQATLLKLGQSKRGVSQ